MEKLILSNIFNTGRLTVIDFKNKLLSFEKDRTVYITSNEDMYKIQFTGDFFRYRGYYSALALKVDTVKEEKEDKTVEDVLKILDNMMNKFEDDYRFQLTDIYTSFNESFSSQYFIADVAEINGQIYIVLSYD